MPNSPVRSWRMLLPLAAVLLLALLWTVYWLVASGIAERRFAEERARFAAQGVTLACAREDWGGYPFHFEFSCVSPALEWKNRGHIQSSSLFLTALAYAPWQIVALLDGPSNFAITDVPGGTASHQRAIAALTYDRDWKLKISAEIPALSMPDLGGVSLLMLHTRPSVTGGTDIAVSARDVNLQRPGTPSLSIGEGEFVGTLTSDRMLKVERFHLQQDRVNYSGSGSVNLDNSNRPSGKLDTQTNDLDGLLAILAPHLQLTEDKKSGLRAMLGLLGNEAKAPIIAKDGILYLGPFKLTELQPLY